MFSAAAGLLFSMKYDRPRLPQEPRWSTGGGLFIPICMRYLCLWAGCCIVCPNYYITQNDVFTAAH